MRCSPGSKTAAQDAFDRGWQDGSMACDLSSPYLLPGGAELDAAYQRGVIARVQALGQGSTMKRDASGMPCALYPGRRDAWKKPQTDERGFPVPPAA